MGIYCCPADKLPILGHNVQRVRSYALNGMMGKNAEPGGFNPAGWVHPGIPEHRKFADVQRPGPSGASFFIDQQSDPDPVKCSVNDGYCGIDFGKKGPVWPDLTGSRHGNGGQLSFSDGHAQRLKWLEPTTRGLNTLNATTKDRDQDIGQIWRTTYPPENW